ncbi:MAG TPA: toll/interleukin-1 receptor domain-containing protein [Aggregatilinea sp.]|uniref:toll/interleukin-1 receptor domain-containing protein n=1 Tax=Aggregatilinea sp. TaxID=2806333 RepID=UPI002BA520D4|nr:toll/interleukin-1 receptor domain-containing protein [Aggregatilinea sp.]HML23619.1 toll/interleukin-1 receptor domain-containing protein [Aggregatilinea sp.]
MQHLYISYPTDNYALAHRLAEDLQTAGYAVFIDPVSEVGSMGWASETRQAIRTCGAMIMILSLAERRRTGIRHEGVLAKRLKRPIVVLARTPGDLPRYLALAEATVLDWSGDYDAALPDLLGTLPPAAGLLIEPPTASPTHPASPARRRRRLELVVALVVLMVLCVALGIVFGWIPV